MLTSNKEEGSNIELLKKRFSLGAQVLNDSILGGNVVFKQLNDKLKKHEDLCEEYKEF